MKRIMFALSCVLLIVGLACLAQAQPPNTRAVIFYKAPAAVAGGCSFPSLTGLLGRWRADTGVTTSSGNVTAVADQSGNGFNLANTGTVPLNATGYNSKPAFDFLASNTAALSVGSFGMGTGQAASVFVVGRMLTATANFGGAIVYGSAGNNDYNGTGGAAFITRSGLTNAIQTLSIIAGPIDTSISLATNYRLGVIFDGSNGTHYVNNSAGSSGAQSGSSFTNNGTLVIGERWLSGAIGSGNSWEGPIAEIVVGNSAWDSTQRGNLDTYFTCQWGT